MFVKIDIFLLSRVYMPISSFFGRKFGKTNADLGSLCIYLYAMLNIICIGLDITTHEFTTWWGVFVVIELLLIPLIIYVQRTWIDSGNSWPNYNLISLFPHRMIWLLFPIIQFIPPIVIRNMTWVVTSLAVASCAYFASLPPAPPKEKREPKGALQFGGI